MNKKPASTENNIYINAPKQVVYRAFTEPAALEAWLVPGEMSGRVHEFDLRVGGGYQMSLYYPESDENARGKTSDREDRYTARFVELEPPRRIVEAITFDSDDPTFAGEMTVVVVLTAEGEGTRVSMAFENIPAGIRAEDNEAGTRSSLEKLKRHVE